MIDRKRTLRERERERQRETERERERLRKIYALVSLVYTGSPWANLLTINTKLRRTIEEMRYYTMIIRIL